MGSLANPPAPVRPAAIDADGESCWRRSLREAIRDPRELFDLLQLPADLRPATCDAGFPLLAPREFVARMRPGDPRDPLLLQVLPDAAEARPSQAPTDAVGDLAATRVPGLLQKYHGRALLTVATRCAINCRYCFRRHFPYSEVPAAEADWAPAFQQLESTPSISEVILSGGDPLVLSDEKLARLVQRLASIDHVRTIRFHSRLPVVVPSRVTEGLLTVMRIPGASFVFVTHVNHAQEIDDEVHRGFSRLRSTGAILLNQAVLLRGVNDSVEALESLGHRLIESGVVPYYLHQLDVVPGVAHFEVEPARGAELIEALRRRVPGYAVPRFVREIAGQPYKAPM